MVKKNNSRLINRIVEFSDSSLEKEYFQNDMQRALRLIKPLILIFGILDTLFVIPDFFLIRNENSFLLSAIFRGLFLILAVTVFISSGHMKDYRKLAIWITISEAAASLVFIFVFYQYEAPNFLIQSFGVMVLVLAAFMVPNRWINMLTVSITSSTLFIILSLIYIKDISMSEFAAGAVYIGIIIIMSSIFGYSYQYYKRVQYFNAKELKRLSVTDPLTGAFNRLKLEEELKQWIDYSRRYKTPLSIMMLDFDNFKRVNDTCGHITGDKVIIEATGHILRNIREIDVFARWGGEEFIILLPNTDLANALELAERLRQKLEEIVYDCVGNVTCSFGVVQMAPVDTPETFMQRADQTLYIAKNSGKNVVKG